MSESTFADARLFGLRVWPRRLTDAEFIEKLRKRQRMYVWTRAIYGLIGIGAVCLTAWMIQMCMGFVFNLGLGPGQQGKVWMALSLAILMGFNVGWMIYGVLHGSLQLIKESRRDRLLVECWDLLQQLVAERDAASR